MVSSSSSSSVSAADRNSTIGIAAMTALASAGLTYLIMMRRTTSKASKLQQQHHTLFSKALHTVNPILQSAGRAKVEREAAPLSRDTPGKTHVVRIGKVQKSNILSFCCCYTIS
jgi:shikimate 5-dehydrogenase